MIPATQPQTTWAFSLEVAFKLGDYIDQTGAEPSREFVEQYLTRAMADAIIERDRAQLQIEREEDVRRSFVSLVLAYLHERQEPEATDPDFSPNTFEV